MNELEKEFDDYFDLFNNAGYKRLIKELSNQLEMIDDLSKCIDLDDLRIRQGQLSILNQLLTFETATRNAYDQWQKELVDFTNDGDV